MFAASAIAWLEVICGIRVGAAIAGIPERIGILQVAVIVVVRRLFAAVHMFVAVVAIPLSTRRDLQMDWSSVRVRADRVGICGRNVGNPDRTQETEPEETKGFSGQMG